MTPSSVFIVQLLLICIRFAATIFVSRMGDGKAFVFDKFLAPCPEERRPLARFENLTWIRDNEYFDYDLVMEWQITKCASKESLDSCVPLTTFKTPNVCSLMESKNDLWSPMLLCAKPALKCPLSSTIYHGQNCTMSMKAFKFFPLLKSFWKIKVLVYSRKAFVFCTMMEGGIQKYDQ